MKRGGVRIAAGSLRGRRLAVASGVRPTEGKVREALLSIWGARVPGARVLDLFAGSGAVGLEALSRGAGCATFVEGSRAVERALQENLVLVAGAVEGKARLLAAELPAALASPRLRDLGPFDLVFADPPYAFDDYAALLAGLESLVAPGGEVALEHSARRPLPDSPGWLRLDRREYGESALSRFAPV